MRVLLASPLGFLIGVTLGAVGGGGSILAVPALVYAAGLDPKQATSASLVIVGAAALAGLPAQVRAGRVRIGTGIAFALAGTAGSIVGTEVNEGIDGDVLLLAFSGVVTAAALGMLVRARAGSHPAESGEPGVQHPARAAAAAAALPVRERSSVDPATAVKVVLAGTLVGFLTGLFGVGGGFVIVPALVLAVGHTMPVAAGTSLLVIAINAAIALAQRTGGPALPWDAILAFGIAAVPGVVVGTRIGRAVPAERLTRWFVVLLLGVAVYTAISSGIALASG